MRVKTYRKLLVLCAFLVLIVDTHESSAQAYRERFGKNRIQHKYFDWNYYSSENFEVYYYGSSQQLAKRSIDYLETQFSRITETIGYPPFAKTRVFLYNSITDLQQSNIGVEGRDFTVGGETSFVQSQLEVPFSGDFASFKKDLVYRVTDMLIDEMLFGGNIAEMFQSALSAPIPSWFTAGVAYYVAYGWNAQTDEAAREYITQVRPKNIDKLDPEMSKLLGQSIWNFVAQRYAVRSISNILNLARIIRNEENSIERTLGLPFQNFMNEWRTFYGTQDNAINENYSRANPEFIISGNNRKGVIYTDVAFSPRGDYLAYASMQEGSYEVRLVDIAEQDEKVLFKGGIRLIDQESDNSYPLLSWADTTTLGIVHAQDGLNMITVKRLGEKGEQQIPIPLLSKIQSFEFKSGGRIAVMTGSLNGVSDAFVYNLVRGQVRHISTDKFDERDITFVPGTNQVVFASNRDSDSVFVSGPDQFAEVEENQFNLFSYDLDYPDSSFTQLTNKLAVSRSPLIYNSSELYYLSNQQGIDNLYKYDFADSISTQVSNFALGIKKVAYDPIHNRLAFISINNSKEGIYLQSFSTADAKFTAVTPRRALEVSKIVAERRQANIQAVGTLDTLSLNGLTNEVSVRQQKLDSLKEGAIDTENYKFKNESKVDTKDYQFESPSEDPTVANRSFLSIYQNTRNDGFVLGPAPYENRFQTDNVITSFVIDEIRSFAQLMEIQMNDYLENHRFKGGIMFPLSFRDGYDVYGEYQYLKNRVDIKLRYSRKSIVRINQSQPLDQRYNLDKFLVGFSYPFSQQLRVEFNPFYAQTKFLDRDFRLLFPVNNPPLFNEDSDRTDSYIGYNAQLVFDNSVVTGTNLHEGTRAKLSLESYFKANSTAATFHNLELDARHYIRVNKAIYLAARVFYGKYFGNAPKRYLLGGVDNWAFNNTDTPNNGENPLEFETLINNSDVLFHQFTNLRGYNYNTFNGRNVATFSGEVRFPINELVKSSNLKSNFLRNLQFVTFYDIGSAWDDLSPLRKKNNLNTEEIRNEGSPFSAIINNFNSAWLQSVGFGMRTMLFGFYSRLDLSLPIRNFETQSPKFQLSFGYDF